jgi:uncharacterized protein YjbI with pentapeptide repeats
MKKVLIALFVFSSLTNFELYSFSKSYSLFHDFSSNKRRLAQKIKNRKDKSEYIRAKNKDFSNEDFSKEILSEISFKYSNFKNTKFTDAFLSSCDFKGANLENTSFFAARLLNIENLEKAKSVKNANFAYAKFLTNEQKEFLRANGAKNVPTNKSQSELIKEVRDEQCTELAGCVGITAVSLFLLSLWLHS